MKLNFTDLTKTQLSVYHSILKRTVLKQNCDIVIYSYSVVKQLVKKGYIEKCERKYSAFDRHLYQPCNTGIIIIRIFRYVLDLGKLVYQMYRFYKLFITFYYLFSNPVLHKIR